MKINRGTEYVFYHLRPDEVAKIEEDSNISHIVNGQKKLSGSVTLVYLSNEQKKQEEIEGIANRLNFKIEK